MLFLNIDFYLHFNPVFTERVHLLRSDSSQSCVELSNNNKDNANNNTDNNTTIIIMTLST